MYNRYVPQPDGTFRRNRMEDQRQKQPARQAPQCPDPTPHCDTKTEPACPHPKPERNSRPNHKPQHEPIGNFLQNLLPKDLDTGDLIVILLLLLLAGDCEEDRSNALLTLALYLFM